MTDLRVIKSITSLSSKEIIDFVLTLLQFCKENKTTSIGVCACYDDDQGRPFIYVDHLSTDPADQHNFEDSALELRSSIIDSLDDWQIEIYDDE